MDMTQSASQPSGLLDSLTISGFWRRVGALSIDLLMLGIVGFMLGAVFYDPLARMGDWAKIFGFVIALAYFGICSSHLSGGQTLAKYWLGLRVVGTDGQTLSMPRSMLRYVLLGLPFFLNGLAINPQLTFTSVLECLVSMLMLGGALSIIYLYIFNLRTRQSLHDLAVGSYVVRAEPTEQHDALLPLWRGHLAVVALLALLGLSAPLIARRLAQNTMIVGILPLYQTLSTQPHVISAQVVRGTFYSGGHTTHSLQAMLRLDAPLTADKAMAKHIAQLMAKGDPKLADEDFVNVSLVYGFNMGIASGWKKYGYSFKPDELDETEPLRPR